MKEKLLKNTIKSLIDNKYALIPGSNLRHLISINESPNFIGRSFNTFDNLKTMWDATVSQMNEFGKPVYADKRSLVSYYSASNNRRTSGKLSSIEYIDPTTIGDPSYHRVHKAWSIEADEHIILKEMRLLMFHILQQVLNNNDSNSNNNSNNINNRKDGYGNVNIDKYEAMQTAYRVTKNINTNEIGDPGPEGVHQDNCVLTSITMINRNNLTPSSAINRIWTLNQPYGKSKALDLKSERLLYQSVLDNTLDTLILLDREVKHEVTSIEPADKRQAGVRDVLTYEIRMKTDTTIDRHDNIDTCKRVQESCHNSNYNINNCSDTSNGFRDEKEEEEEKCGQPGRLEAALWSQVERSLVTGL